jgi:hypothetical protein
MSSGRETQHALSPRPFHPHQARRLLLDWSLPDHFWIGRKSRQFLPSQRSANARASIAAEILALGPSCISSTPQLKREWSPWVKIQLDPRKSTRLFKRIICADISEFESHMPSHAVGLSQVRSPTGNLRAPVEIIARAARHLRDAVRLEAEVALFRAFYRPSSKIVAGNPWPSLLTMKRRGEQVRSMFL